MSTRFLNLVLTSLLLLLLAGCAGPRSDAAAATSPATRAATAAPAAPETPATTTIAAAKTAGAPARAAVAPAPAATSRDPGKPGDLACKTDADCVVKDVGSCCGYRPQCLNKDARTFPEQVKARCASEGRVSTCGMLAVSGCECVQGKCAAQLHSDSSSLVR